MRVVGLSLTILVFAAVSANANVGDWWILPIDRLDGSFTTQAGAGLDGTNAYEGIGMDGLRRVWWSTNNSYQSSAGATLPSDAQLFRVEAWGATAGGQDWQPVEAQYHGYAGDAFPVDPSIPWAGQFGTNHQYIAADGTPGSWKILGPGPQADTTAPADGTMMWMTGGSVMYAKWDFPWSIDRSWSMLRITQITGTVPEPASGLLMLLGGVFMVQRRRSRA